MHPSSRAATGVPIKLFACIQSFALFARAAVAQPSGTALLYPDDVEINFNNHFPVKAALKFRREMDERKVRFGAER